MASASHLCFAYRIRQGRNLFENFDSDYDYGLGPSLLKQMRDDDTENILWIVTRDCAPDFKHIGRKRFEHATTLCTSANDTLIGR